MNPPTTEQRATDAAEVGRLAGLVSEARLWEWHLTLARCGATSKGGVNRQALSEDELAARRQLIEWGGNIGLKTLVDPAANLFLCLQGREAELAPVLTGSHLDTQPTGGRFDGAFGVLAGLEALEALVAAGARPRRSIELVAWMKEGAQVTIIALIGSSRTPRRCLLEKSLRLSRQPDGCPQLTCTQQMLTKRFWLRTYESTT
jgi:N-carbamoyl-L-amino-acid hydrolase